MSELKPCLSLEAAIEHAKERAAKLGDCLCAAEHAQLAEWLEELALRRAQPDNAPLTLAELRGMDGEPVWSDIGSYWMLVTVVGLDVLVTDPSGEQANVESWMTHTKYMGNLYRRKPEPEGGEL